MQTEQQSELDPRVASPDTPHDIASEFREYVTPRREKAGVADHATDTWGLAFSGGGIRSATFCLGLARGLARNGMLKRFDYLSTVSGGGYLGASLGRLYGAGAGNGKPADAAQVEKGISGNDSMWLWWLRNNGRYLTPAGAKDLGYAAASIVRGVISTHLEIGTLILAMASLVLLPHMLVALFPPGSGRLFWNVELVAALPSAWALLLLLPLFACIHQVCSYWYTREHPSAVSTLLIALTAAASCVVAWKALEEGLLQDDAWKCALGLLAIAPATAMLSTLIERAKGTPPSEQRLLRTKRFSYGIWAVAIGIALLLLDWSTWRLTRLIWESGLVHNGYKLGAAIITLTALGRALLPEVQRWMQAIKGPSLNMERILNTLGILLSIAVAVLWTTLLSMWLFPTAELPKYWQVDWPGMLAIPPIQRFALVFLACTAYILASRRSFDLLNLASLHNYYRARIERAYVSSGNCGTPEARFPSSALAPVDPALTMRLAPLTEAIQGDDIDMRAYRPHEWGGPIHLVNACINQSVDDRTGLYNADRKGVALTVSALGVETGVNFPTDSCLGSIGKLSQWVAISGAAASTGMGSRTSPGFAALLFMSGLRLGYWTPSLTKPADKPATETLQSRLLRWAPKPLAIVAESVARFPGLFSSLWYVSDGGHFDNTGIYALLKRRPRVIVAADCGADPNYLFGDLESLTRKAKIDYGASIEFIDGADFELPAQLRDLVGTPESIGPEPGTHWLVLGRIVYSDQSEGTLLVVKPRRLNAMPFDMVAYADRNPDYPHQTTGDQFFDEAQWESYQQLGLLMGETLTPELVALAQEATKKLVRSDSSLQKAQQQALLAESAAPRRKRAGMTVRASVGAGLSLSILLATWQAIEQFRDSRDSVERQDEKVLNDLLEVIRTQPLTDDTKRQLAFQLNRFKDKRGDLASFALDSLNARCENMPDKEQSNDCFDIYRRLTPREKDDYWFADKYENRPKPNATPSASTSANATTAHTTSPDAGTEAPNAGAPPPTAPTIAGPGLPVAPEKPCGENVRLYVHIYDEESRNWASDWGEGLRQRLGAKDAPVENVVATARRRNMRSRYVWTKLTLVFPAGTATSCLNRASGFFPQGINMKEIKDGTPNYLELWVPPLTVDITPTQP